VIKFALSTAVVEVSPVDRNTPEYIGLMERIGLTAILTAHGERWSARDLMPILGYADWRNFSEVIDRAKCALLNAGAQNTETDFPGVRKIVLQGNANREVDDVHLSRIGAHYVAMNGDPRKREIAAAQTYNAARGRG
jgi:DNA-damage-inducible protein D